MNNFDNKYGKSNSCPALMNDGRGVLTSFKNSKQLHEDLKKNINDSNHNEFRRKLQNTQVSQINQYLDSQIENFVCSNNPGGEVKLGEMNLNSNNTDNISWEDGFKDLRK